MYVDTTLVPASGYTYVHNGQIYDQIATTLAAHGNWQYVEYVDAVSAPNTYRRHVWRCKSAGSGLPSDFYIMFETRFTTATGVYATNIPVYVTLAEGYSAGTMSKLASNYVSITPASDLTNPATWALSTFTPPASVCHVQSTNWTFFLIGPNTNNTSIRLLYIVAKDGIMTNWGNSRVDVAAPVAQCPLYMGVYDTLLGAVNDPMPLVMWNYQGQGSSAPAGGTTRAPLQTPGVAVTEVFGVNHNYIPGNSGSLSSSNPKAGGTGGVLGSPGTTTWIKSDGGVQALRAYFSSFTTSASTNSTKGIVRGYSKYVRLSGGSVASHSMGDTFLIDGKVYLGLSSASYGLWDTTAA